MFLDILIQGGDIFLYNLKISVKDLFSHINIVSIILINIQNLHFEA